MLAPKAYSYMQYIRKSTQCIFQRNNLTSKIRIPSLIPIRRRIHVFGNARSREKVCKGFLMLASSATGTVVYFVWHGQVFGRDTEVNYNGEKAVFNTGKDYRPVIAKCRDILQRLKDEVGAPGLVVGVSVDGETVWEEGFGYADVENRVLCSPSTVMRIASISKSITMVAVAKLLEEGKLNIDKPIQYYLPDFPRKTFNGIPVEITCRHLVSHLAGIRHYDRNSLKCDSKGDSKTTNETKQDKNVNVQEKKESEETKELNEFEHKEYYIKDKYTDVKSALDLFKDDALVAKPGSKFHYSTHGWTLISAVVERAAEEPFTTHMTKLFKKLGMYYTYLDVNDSLIYHRSRNYVKDKKGRIINAPYVDNSYKWAGGGFLSTVGDLLKFANVMLYSLQFQPTVSSVVQNGIVEKENEMKDDSNISRNVRDKVVGRKFQDLEKSNTKKNSFNIPAPPDVLSSNEKLHGYLTSKTVKLLWSPVTNVKNKDWMYGMGWAVLPERRDCQYCEFQRFSIFHTGAAVGASSVLLVLPKQCSVQHSLQCQWTSPPKGVIVTIITNLQEISLSNSAFEIAKLFDNYSYKSAKV